jgi:FkbM family methyltransferase
MEGGHLRIIEAAAGKQEGYTKFYGLVEDARGQLSDGGSILDIHNSILYESDRERAITVRVFDFLGYLREMSENYPAIVIKMDIEGGEYEVMNDLIARGMPDALEAVFVEFHSQYMSMKYRPSYRTMEDQIARSFKRLNKRFYLWI